MTEPSLLAEIEAAGIKQGPRCTVATVLDELSAEDADDLRAAMAKPSITAAAIARALRNRGHRINPESVQRHRRGACNC